MSVTPLQLFAVSALISECEGLAAAGALEPSQSATLHCLINHTKAAFDHRRDAAPAEDFTNNPSN